MGIDTQAMAERGRGRAYDPARHRAASAYNTTER